MISCLWSLNMHLSHKDIRNRPYIKTMIKKETQMEHSESNDIKHTRVNPAKLSTKLRATEYNKPVMHVFRVLSVESVFSHVFCLLHDVSSVLSLVFCLLHDVSSVLSLVFCLLHDVSSVLSLVFCLLHDVSSVLSLVLCGLEDIC